MRPDDESVPPENEQEEIARYFRRRNRRHYEASKPRLCVIGDFEGMMHRYRAMLAKVCQHYLSAVAIADVPDAELTARTAYLHWSWPDGRDLSDAFARVPEGAWIINGACGRIGKRTVQAAFAQVFGYPLAVDPLTFRGDAVVKSNRNAAHDGRIVALPLPAADPGDVYERMVANDTRSGMTVDLRVPVICGTIPLVYVKFSAVADRFAGESAFTRVFQAEDILGPGEIRNCLAMVAALSIDYAEIDVLRDNRTGLIYVVDVNTTPSGPPQRLTPRERRIAVGVMARAMLDRFFPP